MADQDDEPDLDAGEPVAELAGIAVPVRPEFEERVRGRIERRLLVGDLIELAWIAPFVVLIEWVTAPFRLWQDRQQR